MRTIRSIFTLHTVPGLVPILRNAVVDSSRLFFIIAGAAIVSWVFAIENVPAFVEATFTSITDNPILIILLINAFFLIMGLWMEPGPMIILFAPVIAPLAYGAGMDPIQFGIMLIIMCNIGLCTPPVGNILFAVCNITKVSMGALSRELVPFLAINLLVVLLIAYVPWLTLAIPRTLGFAN